MKNIGLFVYIGIVVGVVMQGSVGLSSYGVISGETISKHEKINLSGEGKKGLVVVFLSAKCPCSNSHVEELRKLAETYSDFRFVGIHSNLDETDEISLPYFEKIHLPFPVIQDERAEIANRFNALKTPHVFVVTGQDKIVYQGGVSNSKTFSRADRHWLREALSDLQESREVRTAEGRTLGCSIERGEKHVW